MNSFTNMKNSPLISVLLVLLLWGVWQCTPSEYNLVDYSEYSDVNAKLIKHTVWQYKDGILSSKTDARWDGSDTTFTEYEIIKYDDRIDTIETNHYTWANDTASETYRTIKTCNLNGVRIKTVYCELSDSGWIESGDFLKNDSAGRMIENVSEGKFHYWYSYDSSGNFSGRRYEFIFKNKTSYYRDTVIFTDDKLNAIYTENQCNAEGSILKTTRKTIYSLDEFGKIIQKDNVDPDESDSIHYGINRYSYIYDRKGRLKTEIYSSCEYGNTDFVFNEKTEYRYHHGLKTWALYYNYKDGRWQLFSVYKYNYDFCHKLPLKRTVRSGNYEGLPNNLLRFLAIMTEKVDQRFVWTYEKSKE